MEINESGDSVQYAIDHARQTAGLERLAYIARGSLIGVVAIAAAVQDGFVTVTENVNLTAVLPSVIVGASLGAVMGWFVTRNREQSKLELSAKDYDNQIID
jgi:hypothetical protein